MSHELFVLATSEVFQILEKSFSYILRTFLILLFLPLRYDLKGFGQRILMALLIGLWLFYVMGSKSYNLDVLIQDLGYGLLGGVMIFTPLIVIEMSVELTDNLRGLNIANFYDSIQQSNSNATQILFRMYFLVLMLEIGLIEKLLKFLSLTYQSSSIALPKNILHCTLEALHISFSLIVPVVLAFLSVQIIFLSIAKVYPQANFFGEIFLIKLALFLLFSISIDEMLGQIEVLEHEIL